MKGILSREIMLTEKPPQRYLQAKEEQELLIGTLLLEWSPTDEAERTLSMILAQSKILPLPNLKQRKA